MRKVRMGMVGGGEGSFIGGVHRMAAALDGEIELVCAALSSDPARARRSAEVLHLAPERCYDDYRDMMAREQALPLSQRMEFVAIVTPNHLHFPVAIAAIEHGFHVLSDKPATLSLDEAHQLRTVLHNHRGVLYGLTHTYTGYPMVREARARVAAGEIGAVRKIIVDYSQGWLSRNVEAEDNKQAQWRLDPQRSGASACMGDIGVHAANLAEYVSGLAITEVCAELTTFVPQRLLDDDGSVLLRFNNGARGLLHASQICCGEENNLSLRIYGENGGLSWSQEEPNSLWLLRADQPKQLLRTASSQLSAHAAASARVPAGHPEGYIEAFANIYREFARATRLFTNGAPAAKVMQLIHDIQAGVRGMAFIEAVVASSKSQQWLAVPQ